jgi:hypothetical protein
VYIWPFVVNEYLVALPFLIAWLVGIILSLAFFKRYPGMSVLVLIAFIVLVLNALIGTYFQVWAEVQTFRGRRGRWLVPFVKYTRSGFTAAAWLLLLIALFGWRTKKAVQYYD